MDGTMAGIFGVDWRQTLLIAAASYLVTRHAWIAWRRGQGRHAAPALDLRPHVVPFLKATFAGSVMVFVLHDVVPGVPVLIPGDLVSVQGLLIRLAVLLGMVMLVSVIAPLAMIAALSLRALGVPRGWLDVGAGMACMALGLFGNLAFGGTAEGFQPQMLCFLLAGGYGGFVFWRAQGYPGTSRGAAGRVEAGRRAVEVAAALSSGPQGTLDAARAMRPREGLRRRRGL